MERSVRQPTATNTTLRTPTAYANPFATPQAQAIIAPYLADRQIRTPAIAPAPGFISGYNPDAVYSMVGPGGMQWSNTVPSRSLRPGTSMPTVPGGAPLPGVPVGPMPFMPPVMSMPQPGTPGGTVPAMPFPGTGTPATPAVPGRPGTPGVDAVPARTFEEWRNGQLIKSMIMRQAQAAIPAVAAVPGTPARPAGHH